MFADPQSVTIDAVSKTLPLISRSGRTSVYEDKSEGLRLEIAHRDVKNGGTSSLVKLTTRKLAQDPFDADASSYVEMSVHTVIQSPAVGFSETEIENAVLGLASFLDSSAIAKVINGES